MDFQRDSKYFFLNTRNYKLQHILRILLCHPYFQFSATKRRKIKKETISTQIRDDGFYFAALRHSCDGKVNRGGNAPMTRVGQVACCNNRSQSSSPRQPHSQPDPALNNAIVLCVKKPIQKTYSFQIIFPK